MRINAEYDRGLAAELPRQLIMNEIKSWSFMRVYGKLRLYVR